MRRITGEDLELLPFLFSTGVDQGMKLAFETPVTTRNEDQRGRLCPCQGDRIVHAGFRAGWKAVRKVRARNDYQAAAWFCAR